MSSSGNIIASTGTIHRRKQERDYLNQLNSRFSSYMTRVHSVQEQTRSIENAALNAHTASLDAEIEEIRDLYEQELQHVRTQLNEAVQGRNVEELSAKKYNVLSADLENKLSVETNCRKKLETALGDSHRVINEKEASYQEAQISITELQHANVDNQTTMNALRSELTNVTNSHDAEAAARKEGEAAIQKLTDQLSFAGAKYERDATDLLRRLHAAEAAIKISEEKLKEHDAIDQELSNALAKVKQQSHSDFVRYTEESEHSYNASLQSMKQQLNKACTNLEKCKRENIKLRAQVEEKKAHCQRVDAKCASAEEKCKDLIHSIELERQQVTSDMDTIEEQNRKLEETVNNRIRDLNIERSANLATDGELDGLSGLIDAGEQRLSVNSHVNPAPEIISKTAVRRPLTAGRPRHLIRATTLKPLVTKSAEVQREVITPVYAPLPPVSRRMSMGPAPFMGSAHPFMGNSPFMGPAAHPSMAMGHHAHSFRQPPVMFM